MDMTAEELSSARADEIAEELGVDWARQRADEMEGDVTAEDLEDLGLNADAIASATAKHILLDEAAVHLYHRIAQFPYPSSALLNILLRLVDLGLPRDVLGSLISTLPATLSLTPSNKSPWLDEAPVAS